MSVYSQTMTWCWFFILSHPCASKGPVQDGCLLRT